MGFLLMLFLSVIIFLLVVLYFTRTSEGLPKTFAQCKTEIKFNISGVIGCAQDIGLRHLNNIRLYSQPEKIAVVTGGGRGLGLYVVKKLIDCDMTVVIGVRDTTKAKISIENIIDDTKYSKVHYEKLDTGSMSSVRAFAAKVQEKFQKVHILINNAGIMNVPFKRTEDGFESQLAVNYLGHFLLTHLLLPQLKAGGTEECNARIINVSSCVQMYSWINWDDINWNHSYYPADAYGQTKLAQVLFTRHLNGILKAAGTNVCCYAVHPGVVNTSLFDTTGMVSIPWFRRFFFKTPDQGSITVVHAAIHPKLEGKGGGYYSNCIRMGVHPDVKKPILCEKLFDESCKLLKIEKFLS